MSLLFVTSPDSSHSFIMLSINSYVLLKFLAQHCCFFIHVWHVCSVTLLKNKSTSRSREDLSLYPSNNVKLFDRVINKFENCSTFPAVTSLIFLIYCCCSCECSTVPGMNLDS